MQFAAEGEVKMLGKRPGSPLHAENLVEIRGKLDFVGDLYCVFMLPLFNSKQATIRWWPAGVR
jgi:hypothetical protein